MGLQKGLHHLFILSGQQRAGGIQQQAAFFDVACLIPQNLFLQLRQVFRLLEIPVSDIRLFPDNPQAGAGRIYNDSIKGPFPIRHERRGILQLGAQIGNSQPGSSVLNQGNFMGVHITGKDASLPRHGHGRGKALAPGGRAAIQNFHPRL